MSGRTIVGSFNGDTLPERDLPVIVDDVRAGRLDLDGLVSAVWPLEEIADAIAAVRAGEVLAGRARPERRPQRPAPRWSPGSVAVATRAWRNWQTRRV